MSDFDEKKPGIFEGYTKEDVPLASYAALAAVFNLIFPLVLLLARKQNRPIPERMKLPDIILFGVATHKLSWLVAKEAATSPLRAPFTELEEIESPTSVQEKPRGSGLRKSLGELLICQFCLGQWIAAFFAYGLLFFPAVTRLIAAIFAILTLSDHLHQTYQAILKRS